jgi:hypothetical protein
MYGETLAFKQGKRYAVKVVNAISVVLFLHLARLEWANIAPNYTTNKELIICYRWILPPFMHRK